MSKFNQIPISKVTYGGKPIALSGEVNIKIEYSYEDATANDLGSETKQDSMLIGQNASVTIRAAEVNFDVLMSAMPTGVDVGTPTGKEVGFGTSGCVNAQALAKELIITPKCAVNAPVTSIICHKAVVAEGFDWTLAESHEPIEITFTLYPDLTQSTPGTYDNEGQLFFKVVTK